MQILNTFLACLFFTFYAVLPRSIGQEIRDTAVQAMQQISEVISTNASKMVFGKKVPKLTADTEGGRNKSFDQLIAFFEQSENYKLVIRVKEHKELSKQRIAFLYSYIFRFSTLKAQRVEIKQYSPKDEGYFWTFENDELAMSFDSM